MLLKIFIDILSAEFQNHLAHPKLTNGEISAASLPTLNSLLRPQQSSTELSSIVKEGYYSPDDESFSASSVYPYILVGSGTTSPQPDDYKLEDFSDTLTYSGYSTIWVGNIVTISTTVSNVTEQSITVNEIGLHGEAHNTRYSLCFIITRSVLNEPVVLNPGDSKVFAVSINFDKMLETTNNI